MPDIRIKRSKPTSETGRQQESRQSRSGTEVAHRSESYPSYSPWTLRPSDFFSLSPFTLMHRLTEDVNRAFSGVWSGNIAHTWAPPIDLTERDGKLVVSVDLPGLRSEEVKVEVTDENLIIHGERKRENEEQQTAYQHSERRYGSFYRVIPLPKGANADVASAQFKNGILEVIIPIPPDQRPTESPENPFLSGFSIKDQTQLAEAWVTSQLPVRDLERILDIATEAFDDRKKALEWLQQPNIQTGQKPPVTLIGTAEGFDVVETVLRQIQYGVVG